MKLTEATTPTGLSQSTGREVTALERQQQGLIDNNSHMSKGYLEFKHETYRPVVAVRASQTSVCCAAEADIRDGLTTFYCVMWNGLRSGDGSVFGNRFSKVHDIVHPEKVSKGETRIVNPASETPISNQS